MIKRFILLLSALFVCASAFADVLTIRKNAPARYVVKKGDTLWDLSAIYLEKPWHWRKLWGWNPQIKNPHLIYPGDVLSLTYDADGNPQLKINSKVVKLSPKIRTNKKTRDAIPTLPLRIIRPYISYEQSLDAQYLDNLPYVMGSTENTKNWFDGQRVYVSQALDSSKTYAIYRQGQEYIDPETEEGLGFETTLVALAKVVRSGHDKGSPATLLIEDAFTEVKAGDKVLPANEGQMLPAFFKINEPEVPLDATIIASPNNYREYSKYDIVVLNIGDVQSVKPGYILDIFHRSPTVVNDPDSPKYLEDASRFNKIYGAVVGASEDGDGYIRQMPQELVGQVMIFKVYEKMSYALITKAKRPIRIGDTVQSVR